MDISGFIRLRLLRPLPAVRITNDGTRIEAVLDHPPIGNLHVSTLMFGTTYSNYPLEDGPQSLAAVSIVSKPVELLLLDALVKPGMMRGAYPRAVAIVGNAAEAPEHHIPVGGHIGVELLGTGPSALRTADVPNYPEMVRQTTERHGIDVEQFAAWRNRVE